MILDSDIIIYSALPESYYLRDFIRLNAPAFSAISLVEVLGYHKLSEFDEKYFGKFFESLTAISISDQIIKGSIRLRRQQKINLGDSLIAATAIEHDLTLVTNNTKDFSWISDLQIINPLNLD